MFKLLTLTIFGFLMHVNSLEEPINNRCGVDLSVWKKLIELEQEVEDLKNARKGETFYLSGDFFIVSYNISSSFDVK